jgi:hypothetical protein
MIKEDQLKYAVNTDIFRAFHKYLCDKIMVLDHETFKGDMIIYDECKKTSGKCASDSQVTGNYNILKNYSLVYLSPCVFQDEYSDDEELRSSLLSKITSKYCMEYWAFLHMCQDLATFIIYPICKILWPDEEFYLYHGNVHTVVINKVMYDLICNNEPNLPSILSSYTEILTNYDSKLPCIFDFISISIGESRDWIFNTPFHREDNVIMGKNIPIWYYNNFGYDCFDMEALNKIFCLLA